MQKTERIIFTLQLLVTIVTTNSVKPLQISMTSSKVPAIIAGSDVILNCSTTQKERIKEVKWMKDNRQLTEGIDTVKDATGLVLFSTLNLRNVSTKDTNGLYKCAAWTQNNSNVSTLYDFHVDELPAIRITTAPDEITGSCIYEAVLQDCNYISGWPKPAIFWKAPDGKVIKTSLLKASNRKRGTHNYTCVAANRVGTVNKTVQIKDDTTLIPSPTREVTAYLNSSVSLIFYFKNVWLEDMAIYTRFNGRSMITDSKCALISNENTCTIKIKNVVAEDAGNYTIYVQSFLGSNQLVESISLRVEDTPSEPPEPIGPTDSSTLTPTVNNNSSHNQTDIQYNQTDIPTATKITYYSRPRNAFLIGFVSMTVLCLLGFVSFQILMRLVKRRKYSFFKDTKNEKQTPKFDVFVSYTKSDFHWVSKELLPLLDKHHVTYCIHCKDFEIGKTIVDNMADSVYLSKHVIVVLSDRYTASAFCRSEFDMAICRSKLSNKPALTVINLGCSSIKKLTKLNKKTVHIYSVENDISEIWQDEMMNQLKSSLDEPQTV